MIHKFNKRPTKSHLKRNSFSFSKAEVGNVCFNDDVEITVYDGNVIVATHQLTGFVFANSLVKKTLLDGTEILVLKV